MSTPREKTQGEGNVPGRPSRHGGLRVPCTEGGLTPDTSSRPHGDRELHVPESLPEPFSDLQGAKRQPPSQPPLLPTGWGGTPWATRKRHPENTVATARPPSSGPREPFVYPGLQTPFGRSQITRHRTWISSFLGAESKAAVVRLGTRQGGLPSSGGEHRSRSQASRRSCFGARTLPARFLGGPGTPPAVGKCP